MKSLTPVCPYCGQFSNKVGGDVIYPHRKDLHMLEFYGCKPCDAYVGTHKVTGRPLGRLADATLRRAKSAAHKAFDPIWREGCMSRKQAYKWLSEQLGIAPEHCHIGMFDAETCSKVGFVCANFRKKM